MGGKKEVQKPEEQLLALLDDQTLRDAFVSGDIKDVPSEKMPALLRAWGLSGIVSESESADEAGNNMQYRQCKPHK